MSATREQMLEKAISDACDLLAERTYGNTARSPGHNARLRLEQAIVASVYTDAPAQDARDYTAWLIEVDEGASINYFQMVDDDDWTSDQNKAVHFGRKEDAEKVIAYYGWTRARAVEHMWPALKVMPRGGVEYDWHAWSVIYRRRLRALTKLIVKEGFAVNCDGDGMPYQLEPTAPRTPAEVVHPDDFAQFLRDVEREQGNCSDEDTWLGYRQTAEAILEKFDVRPKHSSTVGAPK